MPAGIDVGYYDWLRRLEAYLDSVATGSGLGLWTRDAANGELYPTTIADQLGVGTANPAGQLDVYDAGVDITTSVYGIRSLHTKTAGATTNADHFYNVYGIGDLNQAGGVTGNWHGAFFISRLTDGNVGDAGQGRDIYGIRTQCDLNGGKVWDNAYGIYADMDQEAANEVVGDVFGARFWVDADGTVGGAVYNLYLHAGSNVDYGIYQVGGATQNYFADPTGFGDLAPPTNVSIYEDNADVVPALLIEQDSTGDAALEFLLTGGQAWSVGIDNSDNDAFKIAAGAIVNTNTWITIEITGEVGFGNSSPAVHVEIYDNDASTVPTLSIEQDNTGDAAMRFILTAGQAYSLGIDNSDADKLKISTNSGDVGTSTLLTLTNVGELGVLQDTPAADIHQHEPSSALTYHKFTNDTTGALIGDGFDIGLNAAEQAVLINRENTDMHFYTNNLYRMTLDAGGYFGFNITAPTNPLHVYRNTPALGVSVALIEQDSATGAVACLELQQDDTDEPYIKFTGTIPTGKTGADEYVMVETPAGDRYLKLYT